MLVVGMVLPTSLTINFLIANVFEITVLQVTALRIIVIPADNSAICRKDVVLFATLPTAPAPGLFCFISQLGANWFQQHTM